MPAQTIRWMKRDIQSHYNLLLVPKISNSTCQPLVCQWRPTCTSLSCSGRALPLPTRLTA